MITLHPYQTNAVQSIFDYFATHRTGNPVVAMPTGTGKSLVIGAFLQQVFAAYPQTRVIVATHVKELIQQNSAKLKEMWPLAPYGIYSAGLKQKEPSWPIVFGGVASMVRNIKAFEHRDLLLVDECHLLSPKSDSMYHQVVKQLTAHNPKLRLIGFTATPYRMGLGLITNGGMFTDISYDDTGIEAFNRLIADGYLCSPVVKKTQSELDVSEVGMSNGDYIPSELEEAVDQHDINYKVCKESIELGRDRSTWLAFAAGIKHSEHLAEMLRRFGISAAAIHSKSKTRDQDIADYRAGKLQCVVNNNVLTTGFDHPPIDFIIMARPTQSTGLWVQMIGRGLRPSPETMKRNCLVADFARNTVRLGPINDPIIPKPRGQGAPGIPPIRICDNCGVYNHASARFCSECGMEFPAGHTALTPTAGTDELLRSDQPQIENFRVDRVIYTKTVTKQGIPLLKVTYVCGIRSFNEVVCLEHTGYPGKRARDWWRYRMGTKEAPPSVDEALQWTNRLNAPKRIHVIVNRKYPEVNSYEWS